MDYSIDIYRYIKQRNGVTKRNIELDLSLPLFEVDKTLQRLRNDKLVRSERKEYQTYWYAVEQKGVCAQGF